MGAITVFNCEVDSCVDDTRLPNPCLPEKTRFMVLTRLQHSFHAVICSVCSDLKCMYQNGSKTGERRRGHVVINKTGICQPWNISHVCLERCCNSRKLTESKAQVSFCSMHFCDVIAFRDGERLSLHVGFSLHLWEWFRVVGWLAISVTPDGVIQGLGLYMLLSASKQTLFYLIL